MKIEPDGTLLQRSRYLIILLGLILISCNQVNTGPGQFVMDSVSSYDQQESSNDKNKNEVELICQEYSFENPKERADTLMKYFSLAEKSNDKKLYDEIIFCVFPDSFREMQELFGYDDHNGAAPLYEFPNGDKIIKYFGKLTSIPRDQYYDKYINICIGGIWEADNIKEGFGIQERLLFDTEGVCGRLVKRSDKEILSLFQFIFDGPHPDNKNNRNIYKQLLPRVEKFDKKLGHLLSESFDGLMKENRGHRH